MAGGFAFSNGNASDGPSGPKESAGEFSGINGATTTNGENRSEPREAPASAAIVGKRRRGRPALPRDANGNIIRDGSASGPSASAAGQGTGSQSKKLAVKFTPNNRDQVRQQIAGMHQAVSMLTRQPVFMLSNPEADALTKSLCDVLDYHNINLTEKGGAAGLYVALGLTVFSIYKPRLDFIKNGGGTVIEARPTAAASPGDAVFANANKVDLSADTDADKAPKGSLDFSGDIGPGISETLQ